MLFCIPRSVNGDPRPKLYYCLTSNWLSTWLLKESRSALVVGERLLSFLALLNDLLAEKL